MRVPIRAALKFQAVSPSLRDQGWRTLRPIAGYRGRPHFLPGKLSFHAQQSSGVRLPSSSQSANMSGDRGCQGEVAVPWRNSQRGNSIGPAPKSPNDWASIKPIVAHPFGGVRDVKDPLPNFASAPGDFVACCQSGRQGLQHHSSGWSEGAWRHKHQRRMLQLLLLQ